MSEARVQPDGWDQEVKEYLDELRESGRTNMFGAGAYLIKDLGMDRSQARECLMYWMGTFESTSC